MPWRQPGLFKLQLPFPRKLTEISFLKKFLHCFVSPTTTTRISHNYAYATFLLSLPEVSPSHPSSPSQSSRLGSQCYQQLLTSYLFYPRCISKQRMRMRWLDETTEDEMVGWYHRLDGHEFQQAPGVDDGQGSLACCSPWGRKESNMTE